MRKEVVLLVVALVAFSGIATSQKAPLIELLDHDIIVCESTDFSYKFNVVELDGDTLSLDIHPQGPFYVRPISYKPPITQVELFSQNLSEELANNVYEHTIYASDGKFIDSHDIKITVLEANDPPSIKQIPAQTIDLDESTFHQIKVSVDDKETGSNPKDFRYEVADERKLLDISVSDIGIITIQAFEQHIGTHDVTLCVTDNGLSNIESKLGFCGVNKTQTTSCESFQLSIVKGNRPPTILASNVSTISTSIISAQQLILSVSTYDPDRIKPEVFWLVDDKVKQIDSDNSLSIFEYTFGCDVWGRHKIQATTSDGLINDSVQWFFDVRSFPCPPGVIKKEKIGKETCEEKWGCSGWSLCQSAQISKESGSIDNREHQEIQQRCTIRGWDESSCGYQTRSCADTKNCNTVMDKPLELIPCQFSLEPSCTDNIKNCHDGSCEFLTDCGGPCSPCMTCSDNLQNQGEQGIDCGGPCARKCVEQKPAPGEVSENDSFFKKVILISMLVATIIASVLTLRIQTHKKYLDKEIRRGQNE